MIVAVFIVIIVSRSEVHISGAFKYTQISKLGRLFGAEYTVQAVLMAIREGGAFFWKPVCLIT